MTQRNVSNRYSSFLVYGHKLFIELIHNANRDLVTKTIDEVSDEILKRHKKEGSEENGSSVYVQSLKEVISKKMIDANEFGSMHIKGLLDILYHE